MQTNTVEEIIADLEAGKMVVIMDDEDRENEGDLLMAAECVRPEDINFMARYGRGLICLTLTRDRCEQLKLPLMVTDNNEKHSTNFTVSIEAADGVTTGISAADRAVTVQAAVKQGAQPADIVQPGHIFPLMAMPGGVLTRAGHTEAGCDLARIAGFEPAAVIVEILNEDGTMARRPDLEIFAEEHGLKMGTIADLIEYRVRKEKSIERVAECDLPTEYGQFRLCLYNDIVEDRVHYALSMGEINPDEPTLVRVHLNDTFCDLFAPQREDSHWPLSRALKRVAEEGHGLVVVMSRPNDDRNLVRRIQNYALQDRGMPVPKLDDGSDLRTYGIGAQIVSDMGVKKMRVILTAPKRVHAIAGFGLEVVETVTLD
jgi:3,4-dihydroxy 2-butanone 4-phosphate synthase/GTP cyclohydrolase II